MVWMQFYVNVLVAGVITLCIALLQRAQAMRISLINTGIRSGCSLSEKSSGSHAGVRSGQVPGVWVDSKVLQIPQSAPICVLHLSLPMCKGLFFVIILVFEEPRKVLKKAQNVSYGGSYKELYKDLLFSRMSKSTLIRSSHHKIVRANKWGEL